MSVPLTNNACKQQAGDTSGAGAQPVMVAEGVAQRQTVRRVSGNQTLNRLRPCTLHLATGCLLSAVFTGAAMSVPLTNNA
jgi:hypothetical protein